MNSHSISSFINSRQNIDGKLHLIDFEHIINENIIPTSESSNPTELNVGNENTVENISKEVETLTCLQEFDEILDNVCKQNLPTVMNSQYEIDIEVDITNSTNVDDFGDWQNNNIFVKNTELNTVEYCSDSKENRSNYLEIPIDNNEHSNVNNHLNTWKSIYEDFLAKTNDVTGVNVYGENKINAEKRIKTVLDDLAAMKHDNTYYLNSEVTISKTPGASTNKTIKPNLQTEKKNPTDSHKMSTVDTRHKHAILNFIENHKKNSKANLLKKPFTNRFKIEGDTDLTIEPNNKNYTKIFQEYQERCLNMRGEANNKRSDKFELKKHEVNMKYLEVPVSNESSNTGELAKEERESNSYEYLNIHKQSTKTEEFEKQGNYSDCDGYNSSDFEFIDENEATKNVPYLNFLFDESNNLQATTNNGPDGEVDTASTNNDPKFEVCSEINDEKGSELPLPSIESLFAIHDNQKAINFNEFCDEANIIHDYFKSLEPTVNNNVFDNSYRDSHRIPNADEYVNLFGGNFTPCAMHSFENKATHFGTGMSHDVGFDMSIFRDESTPEQRREAKETELEILAMYPVENRSHRRRRR